MRKYTLILLVGLLLIPNPQVCYAQDTPGASRLLDRLFNIKAKQKAKEAEDLVKDGIAKAGDASGTPTTDLATHKWLEQIKNTNVYKTFEDMVAMAEQAATLEEQLEVALGTNSILGKAYSTGRVVLSARESIEGLMSCYSDYMVSAQMAAMYYQDLFESGEVSMGEIARVLSFLNSTGLLFLNDLVLMEQAIRDDSMTVKERVDQLRLILSKANTRKEIAEGIVNDEMQVNMENEMYRSLKDAMMSAYGSLSLPETMSKKEAIKATEEAVREVQKGKTENKLLNDFVKEIGSSSDRSSSLLPYLRVVEVIVFLLAMLLATPVIIRTNSGEAQSANAMRKLVFVTIGFFLIIEVFNLIIKFFLK